MLPWYGNGQMTHIEKHLSLKHPHIHTHQELNNHTTSTFNHNENSTKIHFESRRPGRTIRKLADKDPNVITNYGDSIHTKDPSIVRILFQNVKGLAHSSSGQDYEYCLHNIQLLQLDIVGMAETNTPWQLHHFLVISLKERGNTTRSQNRYLEL